MTRLAKWMAVGATLALVGCGGGSASSSSLAKGAGPDRATRDVPVISAAGETQKSISVQVCAGASGAAAGFTLQWMTAAEFAANGDTWSSSVEAGLCDASFSGHASLSNYILGGGECVTVDVGALVLDSGVSTTCGDALSCGTEYVFRAFAHGDGAANKSDFTAPLHASTEACDAGCTFTQGYWKTHGPVPTGGNTNVWPVTELSLGTVSYTDVQLQSIFNTPVGGNGLISLAHQLIAAKLNVATGASADALGTAIADADALVGGLIVPPVGTGYLAPADASALLGTLGSYNEGAIGPGHCE